MSQLSTTALRKRFERLVQKAEAEIATNPEGYRLRLVLLAALGYVVIVGLLVLLITILGGTVYAALMSSGLLILLVKSKLFIVLAVAIWILFRSLFVRISAPTGLPLARSDYPRLWGEVDGLRSSLAALPVHEAVLTGDMNAAVAQTPRFGIFGPHKNTLVLGLELLMTLSPQQARSVLAHEFGHLSGSHGRFGNWIYRKRLTWARIGQAFSERGGLAAAPMTSFISWYVPRLTGYSFALARNQEYEADAVAVRLTTREDAAAALMLVNVRDEITRETFWKPLLQRAILEPEPETQTFTKLFQHLKSVPVNATLADVKLGAALRVKTGYADTHPALRDRLKAIAAGPVSLHPGETAAESWLGKKLGEVLAHFDLEWLERNGEAWRQRHETAQASRRHLEQLAQKPADELTQAESWQVATLIEDVCPDADPLPAYLAYKDKYPHDRDADFAIGRIQLIEREDPRGLAYLEIAADDPRHAEVAAGLIAAYHQSHERPDLAEVWQSRAEVAYDRMSAAQVERNDVLPADTFQPPRLDAALLVAFGEAVGCAPVAQKIKRVWIAEKVVAQFPEWPIYVVLAEPHLFTLAKEEIGQRLAAELSQSTELPHTWLFLTTSSTSRKLASKLKASGHHLRI
ncbi:MAG: M48 family metalloprotease [Hyphomicrobium sp.]|nr:M48 family metalloprotease [Hyphomicrobium sp.]